MRRCRHIVLGSNSAVVSGQQGQRVSWQDLVERTVSGLGYDLVECERSVRGLLRVYIDRLPGDPAGEFITVDDCEKVTRQLQYLLEVENVPYERLEVSSPGLDRLLRNEADFRRFAGEQVEVTLKLAFHNRKKFKGVLEAEGEGWRLVFTENKQEQALNFSLEEVREARLVPVVDFKGRRRPAAREAQSPGQSSTQAPAAGAPGAGTQEDGGQES